MISRRLSIGAVLGLLVLALSASPASGAETTQVPIQGTYSGTAVFATANTVTFQGTGVSSHLGLGTNQGIAIITGPDSTIPGGLDNTNTETFTAANGDTITVTSQDVAVPVAPGVTHGTGTWKVTSGTGRFLRATGNGTLSGQADFSRGTFEFELAGTICIPNS